MRIGEMTLDEMVFFVNRLANAVEWLQDACAAEHVDERAYDNVEWAMKEIATCRREFNRYFRLAKKEFDDETAARKNFLSDDFFKSIGITALEAEGSLTDDWSYLDAE